MLTFPPLGKQILERVSGFQKIWNICNHQHQISKCQRNQHLIRMGYKSMLRAYGVRSFPITADIGMNAAYLGSSPSRCFH